MRFLFLGLLAGSLLALPTAAQNQLTMHDLMAASIKVQGADCALFPAAALLDTLAVSEVITGRFSPTRSQVEITENQLSEKGVTGIRHPINKYDAANLNYIQKHLPSYKRQYFGFYNAQHQSCLFIQFFEGDITGWLSQHLLIMDGGTSVWEACYNLDTRKFSGASYHSQG